MIQFDLNCRRNGMQKTLRVKQDPICDYGNRFIGVSSRCGELSKLNENALVVHIVSMGKV